MQIFFTEPSLLVGLLQRIRIFKLDLHHITAVLCGFNEGEGLGATLRGVEGLLRIRWVE